MKLNDILGAMILFCVLAGCTVTEDRTKCPCLLTLDFSTIDTLLVPHVDVLLTSESGTLGRLSLDADTFMPEYLLDVPRSELMLNVYSCENLDAFFDCGIKIPQGKDCPRIYMHSSKIMSHAEKLTERVIMLKNHCVMDIVMDGESEFKYWLYLKGNVCGYGLDGTPVEGPFEFRPSVVGYNTYQAVLPRQIDSSLVLEIDDGDGVVKKFALGEHLLSCGYDWSAADLQDLEVHIDWRMTVISVTVKEWNSRFEHEIIV